MKRVGSSDAACRHGLIWDHTVFHVVASCRANPAMVAPSKRNCRIARAPQTRPGSTHRVVLLNESHDLAGAFSAYPASFKPPDTHRDPGPGRVDHLYRHTPVTLCDSAHIPGSQHSDHRTLCRAPEHTHVERQGSDGSPQTDEQITPVTTIKRHRAVAGRVRHCRGP